MFRPAILLIGLAAIPSTVGASDVEAGSFLRPFGGRSGATKEKLLVCCGVPERELHGGLVPGLAARVKEARGGAINEKALRRLAEQWSGDVLRQGPKTREEVEKLLMQLPPKQRQIIKDYFEKLEKK